MKIYYTLSIPNKEVRATYTGIIDRYFSTKIENQEKGNPGTGGKIRPGTDRKPGVRERITAKKDRKV
jgi:hypothetical protein